MTRYAEKIDNPEERITPEEYKALPFDKRKEYETTRLHVDINIVDNDFLNIEAFKNWRPEYTEAEFIFK